MQVNSDVNRRAGVMLVVAAVAIFGLVAQLGNLQLLQQNAFQARAESQRTREMRILAPRGIIYDRNLRPIATNRAANVLLLQYPQYKDIETVSRLASILGVPYSDLTRRVERRLAEEEQWGPRYWEPLQLVDNLTLEQHARVLERLHEFPGVIVDVRPVRDYPFREVGAAILGYVAPISPAELEALSDKGYTGDDQVGKAGLEKFYEGRLHGQDGVKEVEIDYGSKPIGEVRRPREPVAGESLVLTVDWQMQEMAERALEWNMFRLRHILNIGDGRVYDNARAGAVAVINVKTGAILAMASRPGFDPNLFVNGISEADYQRLVEDPNSPLWNRAVAGEYHPGSTWKMVTAGAALHAGVITPQERVFSGRFYEPTGQKDWVTQGHGWVDAVNALRLSSDIYFYEMGRRLGIARLNEYARGFGFGQPTGIDLPGELPGFLPDDEYRDREGQRGRPWTLGSTTSAAIGQIYEVTPIQLAQYVAELANGGRRMKPYLVDHILAPDGSVVYRTEPEETGQMPVSPAELRYLIRGMELVNGPSGTSDFAIWPLPGIKTAGKTGTSENPPQDDYGVFVGFAPLDDPQIGVAVVVEQAGHGGSVSPVARTLMAHYFGAALPPKDPALVPPGFPANEAEIRARISRGEF